MLSKLIRVLFVEEDLLNQLLSLDILYHQHIHINRRGSILTRILL